MNSFSKLAIVISLLPCVGRAEGPVRLDPFMHSGRTVQARIGGKLGTFLLDTGGGVTNISPEFAAAIGCKPGYGFLVLQ